ncbi:hypothetical protein ACW9HQ_38095, partial [Nocardia gipuzkoensis]
EQSCVDPEFSHEMSERTGERYMQIITERQHAAAAAPSDHTQTGCEEPVNAFAALESGRTRGGMSR